MRNKPRRTPEDVLGLLRETLKDLHYLPDPDIDPSTRAIFRLALNRRISNIESEAQQRKMREEHMTKGSSMCPSSLSGDLSRSTF
jgi:hypothetical protein